MRSYACIASLADVLRLVTSSSPRTSAELSAHFRSLAVGLCFGRTNHESVSNRHVSLTALSFVCHEYARFYDKNFSKH